MGGHFLNSSIKDVGSARQRARRRMRGRERKEELKEMEKEHGQRSLYLRSKRMENKKKTPKQPKTFTWCHTHTRSHSADWNHMLTDIGNNGKLELFNLFSRFVALGRGVGEMAGVEGIRDWR